ncbi:MAG: hypothetical protein R3338_14585, partial [Thermoanaerobaculia bacterium]|nr:hypothetical protein [Thermoanaerobaculia bacterium]
IRSDWFDGSVWGDSTVLHAAPPEQTSTCASVTLHIDERSSDRIAGIATGRCYGTVSGVFELHRG